MEKRRIFLMFSILFLFYSSPGKAIVVELFSNGNFVEDYEDKIENLFYLFDDYESEDSDGQVFLKFSNGEPIRVLGPLGRGNQALVLEAEDGQVVRVPIKAQKSFQNELVKNLTTSKEIHSLNPHLSYTPIYRHPEQPHDGLPEFLIGPKIDIRFTFDKFFKDIASRNSIHDKSPKYDLAEEEINSILSKLVDLAEESADIISIDDLHTGNISFEKKLKKWMIHDYSSPIKAFAYGDCMTMDLAQIRANIFDQGFIHKQYLTSDLSEKIRAKVLQKRLEKLSEECQLRVASLLQKVTEKLIESDSDTMVCSQ